MRFAALRGKRKPGIVDVGRELRRARLVAVETVGSQTSRSRLRMRKSVKHRPERLDLQAFIQERSSSSQACQAFLILSPIFGVPQARPRRLSADADLDAHPEVLRGNVGA